MNGPTTGTLLVTGASGLLGARVVHAAQGRWARVVAAYRTSSVPVSESVGTRIVVKQVDLRRAEQVEELTARYTPTWIVHCAAQTDVDACEADPDDAWQMNVAATETLAKAAAAVGGRMLYISTDAVFDGARGRYHEGDLPRPLNVYARTKLEGERRVAVAGAEHLIVRTNLFGLGGRTRPSLAEWMLARLEKGLSFQGYTDVVFAPLWSGDLAQILLAMLDRNLKGLYHAASSDALTKYTFAVELAHATGLNERLIVPAAMGAGVGVPGRARRPLNTSLNAGRLASALGQELPAVRQGISRMVQARRRDEVAAAFT